MTLLAKRIQRDHGWLFLTSVIQNLFVMPVKTGIQAGRMPYAPTKFWIPRRPRPSPGCLE
jgi:hypothetical protein